MKGWLVAISNQIAQECSRTHLVSYYPLLSDRGPDVVRVALDNPRWNRFVRMKLRHWRLTYSPSSTFSVSVQHPLEVQGGRAVRVSHQ
jgi:hypothetical protein